VNCTPSTCSIEKNHRPCSNELHAVDVLHREEPQALLERELVERHEVGVRHVGDDAELALEPHARGGVVGEQRLQRHPAAALAVDAFVDAAHAAFAQPADHVVATDAHRSVRCARGQPGQHVGAGRHQDAHDSRRLL
jgi:hypothetical protein